MAGRQKAADAPKAHKDTTDKKPATKAKVHQKVKTIKIKHHHAKVYRKRHVSALFVLIIIASVLSTWLIIYREQVIQRVDSAQSFLSDVFNPAVSSQQNVNSTYGYNLQYDARTFSASAIDSATGDLFIGQELSVNRPYETVRVFTGSSDLSKKNQRSLTLLYWDDQPLTGSSDAKATELEKTVANSGLDASITILKSTATSTETIGGVAFKVTEWKVEQKAPSVGSKIPVEFRTYTGAVNGKALTMKLTYGLSTGQARESFKAVIASLKFGARKQAAIVPSKQVADKLTHSRSLLDTITLTGSASAAAAGDNSEQISSRYSPAVVKIYNFYCMDITIDGQLLYKDICDAFTGSGFFIDGQGSIGTNGHVGTADPLDILITHVIDDLIAGDPRPFNLVGNLAGIKDSDFKGDETELQVVDIVVNKMYALGASRVKATNNVDNLLVGLNDKSPDLEELFKLTENNEKYAEQDSIKPAKLIAADYRAKDGFVTWKASDVAIVKIEGSNYPVTKLGSIDGLTQGAGLLIIGFPGAASSNGLVDTKESKSTLTAGKVSSVKSVEGGRNKVIETDTTFGHGNSGGPAFDESGSVVGVATYTVDGTGSGNGTFNYVRDIKDLKDLAAESSVTPNPVSITQTEWNKGIDLFYKAHYSKAVKSFEKVKTLYPQHPKASELIAAANVKIKNGEDVKDFPYIIVGIAVAAVAGIGVTLVMIMRHRKAHNVYAGQVAGGYMQPMAPGALPQVVNYNPGNYSAAPMPAMPVAPAPIAAGPQMPQQMPVQPAVPQMPQQPTPQVFGPAQTVAPQQPVQPADQQPRKIQF
jgi:S1-C subfamily serine protease